MTVGTRIVSALQSFRAAIESDMRHGPMCATKIDAPEADCSCDRRAVLAWIDHCLGVANG